VKNPAAVSKIREVVAMRGAFAGPGNIGKPFVGIRNGVAEWNCYLDPQAADIVLRSGVKVRVCEEFNPEVFKELFLLTILE
jgi:purine nucleosidase